MHEGRNKQLGRTGIFKEQLTSTDILRKDTPDMLAETLFRNQHLITYIFVKSVPYLKVEDSRSRQI